MPERAPRVKVLRDGRHYIQTDVEARAWPEDAARLILHPESISSFEESAQQQNATTVAVYVYRDEPELRFQRAGRDAGRALVGVAAVSMGKPTRGPRSVITFYIHGIAVQENEVGGGLGQELYRSLHEAVFERAQVEYARQHLIGREPPPTHLQLTVLPGGCRRLADALLLYAQNGWRIARDNGDQVVTMEELKSWLHEPQSHEQMGLHLTIDRIPLTTGYFDPLFDRRSPVKEVDALSSTQSFPPNSSKLSLNQQIQRRTLPIGPHNLFPSTKTGVAAFFVAAVDCRKVTLTLFLTLTLTLTLTRTLILTLTLTITLTLTLTLTLQLCEFLSDPVNYRTVPGYPFPVSSLEVGASQLTGFSQYDNIQAPALNSAAQASLTVRTEGLKDLKALREHAPGFDSIVDAVLESMGYDLCGYTASDQVRLLAAHFFRVEPSQQTSFAWHTDDDDLGIKNSVGRLGLRSAVIQLGSQTRTALQLHSFAPFTFEGSGAGALFHGAALHRSVTLDPPPQGYGVWKLTLFFLLHPKQVKTMSQGGRG
jgi:hypothetical protein